MNIKLSYQSIDRYHETRTFKTLAGAQKYAQKWVGETPEMGRDYAISGDGIGKVYLNVKHGHFAEISIAELFPNV